MLGIDVTRDSGSPQGAYSQKAADKNKRTLDGLKVAEGQCCDKRKYRVCGESKEWVARQREGQVTEGFLEELMSHLSCGG